VILIVAHTRDKYRSPTYSMFGNTGTLRAVFMQKKQVIRVNVVLQKIIYISVYERTIIWKL
jgi:hypothetical protein